MQTTLPQHPSLTYLKQAAKTLKRGVDRQNDALSYRIAEHLPRYQRGDLLSLSDAQFVIAREHGFASWPKLKHALSGSVADVKRMDKESEVADLVHIVCGDIASTSLKQAKVAGQRLVWRDLLCIGPLPKCHDYQAFFTQRAEFIKGWTQLEGLPSATQMARDEQQALLNTLTTPRVVLWIWPHLSNHLMLLMLLDWYCVHQYEGELCWVDASEQAAASGMLDFASLATNALAISVEQRNCAARLWQALREDTPQTLLARLTSGEALHFSQLEPSLWRYVAELPSIDNGLSELQRQVLQAIDEGALTPEAVFRAVHRSERYFIAGDWAFWQLIAGLINVEYPLIQTVDGACFFYPPSIVSPGFSRQQLLLTEIGRQVLAGEQCHIALNGTARAWGGIAQEHHTLWRYDPQSNPYQMKR